MATQRNRQGKLIEPESASDYVMSPWADAGTQSQAVAYAVPSVQGGVNEAPLALMVEGALLHEHGQDVTRWVWQLYAGSAKPGGNTERTELLAKGKVEGLAGRTEAKLQVEAAARAWVGGEAGVQRPAILALAE